MQCFTEALVDAGYSVNSLYTGTDGIREVIAFRIYH